MTASDDEWETDENHSSGGEESDDDDDNIEVVDVATSRSAAKAPPPTAKTAKKSSDDSSDDDDGGDMFSDSKRRKLEGGKMSSPADDDASDGDSDSSSDESMIGGGGRQSALAAARSRMAAKYDKYSEEESDSDESCDFFKRRGKKAKPQAKPKKAVLNMDSDSDDDDQGAAATKKHAAPRKSKAIDNLDDTLDLGLSDADGDDLPSPPKRGRRSPRRSTRASPRISAASGGGDHEDALKLLAETRKIRAGLDAANKYKAKEASLPEIGRVSREDVIDIDDEDDDDDDEPTFMAAKPPSKVAPKSAQYDGPNIKLTLLYQNAPGSKDKEGRSTLAIHMKQPLSHLGEEFKSKKGGAVKELKFDGQKLDLSKTPAFYDMEDEDMVEATVSFNSARTSTVTIHVRDMTSKTKVYKIPSTDPLTKLVRRYSLDMDLEGVTLQHNGRVVDPTQNCERLGLVDTVNLDAVFNTGGKPIDVKLRINGQANDVETLRIQVKGKFQSLMSRLAEKKGVTVDCCKFVIDGEAIRPGSTPEDYDLEGGEMIDVSIPEVKKQPAATSSRPLAQSKRVLTAANGTATTIKVQTNRNKTSKKTKSWKLSSDAPLSKLRTEYIKYYRSKGCKVGLESRTALLLSVVLTLDYFACVHRQSVEFYSGQTLIQGDNMSFKDLGILDNCTLVAMENSKSFR